MLDIEKADEAKDRPFVVLFLWLLEELFVGVIGKTCSILFDSDRV